MPYAANTCAVLRRIAQFRRQFHACRAGADHGNVNTGTSVIADTSTSVLGPDAGGNQLAPEVFRLVDRIECDGMFFGSRYIEKVRDTSDGEHQGVVLQFAGGKQFISLVVEAGGHRNALARPINVAQFSLVKFEVVPSGLRDVIELMRVRVHAAGRDLVQERLPDVGWIAVHKEYFGLAPLAEPVAQPSGQAQPAGAASHHDNAMSCICCFHARSKDLHNFPARGRR